MEQQASPSRTRTATGRLVTERTDAPIVGGTVYVWYLDDGEDTDDIDIEEDPVSPKDPDAGERYDPGTPS
ncbi:hypothetical protein [Nocardia australiensis]|uniref:hypothetical protein n=1 Tax=Nocardia australiensis TaxID=2887191 RepID=UPI001D13ED7D|nr:hypothetical protein [Nocardia australiensis]